MKKPLTLHDLLYPPGRRYARTRPLPQPEDSPAALETPNTVSVDEINDALTKLGYKK